MNLYNYNDIVDELINEGVITGGDVYDITLYPQSEIFSRFFEYSQRYLSEYCVERSYNIEPSRIYFTNSKTVNAAAGRGSLYYVIKINMGAVHNIFDLYCNNTILDDPELFDYKELGGTLSEDADITLDFLLLQCATSFTFYHELGHLIQFSNRGGIKAMLTEQYSGKDDEFDPLKHILEFDSDQHAANSVAFHVIDLWNKLSQENQTEENIKKLVVVSLVGILGYIFFLWRSFNMDIYYDKYDHPHPLIRIVWVMVALVNTAKINIDFPSFDEKSIIEETLKVLNVYLRSNEKGDIQDKFIKPLAEEYYNIMEYSQAIIRAAETIPYLAVNTVHKSGT